MDKVTVFSQLMIVDSGRAQYKLQNAEFSERNRHHCNGQDNKQHADSAFHGLLLHQALQARSNLAADRNARDHITNKIPGYGAKPAAANHLSN